MLLIGDMNAKVGKEDIYLRTIGKHNLHEESNENETKLINFAAAKNMVVVSTCFLHKSIHKQTWISPGHRAANQIDHVIIEAKHFSDVMDVGSYRGANVDSDHYLVVARIRARISTIKEGKRASQKRYSTDRLKHAKI